MLREEEIARLYPYVRMLVTQTRRVRFEDVDDVVQDILLNIWLSRERFDSRLPLAPWVRGIAAHVVVDFLRSSGRRRHRERIWYDKWRRTGAIEQEATQRLQGVRCLLGCLEERERVIVELYYFKQMTMREIGGMLGVKESRISQIHKTAIQKLRKVQVG